MPRDAYKDKALGYAWKTYEHNLAQLRSAVEALSYSASGESDDSPPDVKTLLHRPTSFETELFLLPRDFALIPISSLLRPLDIPQLPTVPESPPLMLEKAEYPQWYLQSNSYDRDIAHRREVLDEASAIRDLISKRRQALERARDEAKKEYSKIQRELIDGNLRAAEHVILLAHQRHPLPQSLRREYQVIIAPESKIALVDFAFPDYSDTKLIVGYTGARYPKKPKYASAVQAKKYVKLCLYSLIVRSAYLAANFCFKKSFESVVVNVEQSWHDPATGAPRSGLIASFQAPVDQLRSLDLSKLDPEACFRQLKGIATPSLQSISPIRPIFVLNREDKRFVGTKEIDSHLEPETNLAAMPWEDFEHLVAQLFEWEFQSKGIEVRVTRASRDKGVDAVLFDPDPLRGGKYVLQAKRYTRAVDVSAVRDLYGTLMNEGANRGILITTSSFGPDAYDFVKDKPISLVDGPNLVLMLQKHGKKYRIDLDEARRLSIE